MSELNGNITLENLYVKFGNYTALENLNLLIAENKFVSVVGPNGAGKSTLLKVMLGLLQPSSGSVRISGKLPQELPAKFISYVPQIKTLDRSFPALPIELVASGLLCTWSRFLSRKVKNESLAAMEQVGAAHLAKRPLGKLSGGELQRIYLARTLVRKPKLLILDEPATGIDYIGEKDIHKIIDEYKVSTGATIVLVTHDWESAYHHADFVLLLNRRQICFDAPDKAFSEANLRRAFGHVGHEHEMIFGVGSDG